MQTRPLNLQPYEIEIYKSVFYQHPDHVNNLNSIPLGALSIDFINNNLRPTARLNLGLSKKPDYVCLRLTLEDYISTHDKNYLAQLERMIKRLITPIGLDQDRVTGTYLMPDPISKLMQAMYLLNDDALIFLLKKYFPEPPQALFTGHPIPKCVQKRSDEIDQLFNKFKELKDKEPIIHVIQRKQRRFRKRRYQQEIERIKIRDQRYLKENLISAQALFADASTPYTPQCNPALAKRIMNAAKWVANNKPAFTSVKHITWPSALESIFNDALYGQSTLRELYLPFRPAVLVSSDVENGDANSICLGPGEIDPGATGTIIITFDISKFKENKNFNAFFKLRDLEYRIYRKKRTVHIGREDFIFDHTPREGFLYHKDDNSVSDFLLINKYGLYSHYSEIQKSTLINYNLEKIHEISILNFFRFIDNLISFNSKDRTLDKKYIAAFYKKIAYLTDDELVKFLIETEINITDTAEFNFYGAYRLDFSSIKKITATDKKYVLTLSELITSLDLGNINELRLAYFMIPELFASYRFIDYLMLKTTSTEARYYLDDLRKKCKTPRWIQYRPLALEEKMEAITWEIDTDTYMKNRNTPAPPSAENPSNQSYFNHKKSNAYFYFALAGLCLSTLSGAIFFTLALNLVAIKIGVSVLATGIGFFGLSYRDKMKLPESIFDEPKNENTPRKTKPHSV